MSGKDLSPLGRLPFVDPHFSDGLSCGCARVLGTNGKAGSSVLHFTLHIHILFTQGFVLILKVKTSKTPPKKDKTRKNSDRFGSSTGDELGQNQKKEGGRNGWKEKRGEFQWSIDPRGPEGRRSCFAFGAAKWERNKCQKCAFWKLDSDIELDEKKQKKVFDAMFIPVGRGGKGRLFRWRWKSTEAKLEHVTLI